MNTLAFWLPLFLLFLSALVGALIKRRSCDHCLKRFDGNQVLLPIGTKDWICGKLEVFAQGLEISSPEENQIPCGFVHSRIIPSKEVAEISLLIRQAPDPDTRAGLEWKKERQMLLNPPLRVRLKRFTLNSYNMLRDSFGQALKAIIGTVSKETRLGKAKGADSRFHEMQSNLTGMVPNAWEPILEKYRGKLVAIERMSESGEIYESGILEDYSDKYLLLRDVKLIDPAIKNALGMLGGSTQLGCDVLYSRTQTLLRYSLKSQSMQG
jgi:hypothetical protein